MILGIGIDIIDIHRFADWFTKNEAELSRAFSPSEIVYCTQNTKLSAERFAVRFAAKEAFYKAYQAMLVSLSLPSDQSLLAVQKMVSVIHLQNGVPALTVNWNTLLPQDAVQSQPQIHLSLSHADNACVAMVVLEKC